MTPISQRTIRRGMRRLTSGNKTWKACAAAAADGVIHTAFIHDISHASISARFQILFGGLRRGLPSSFMATVIDCPYRKLDLGKKVKYGSRGERMARVVGP